MRAWTGLILAGATAMLSAGCAGQLSPQAEKLLADGRQACQAGDDRAAIRHLDAFLAGNARGKRADEAYYLRGLAKYRLKDLPGARADLAEALRRTSRPDLRGLAAKTAGDTAFESGDAVAAEAMYAQAVEALPADQPPGDEARYRRAQTLQRLGRWAEADLQFSRMIHHFSGSPLALRAGRQIHATAWTVQVAAVSTRRAADALAAEAKAKGLDAFVAAVQAESGPMFAVQAGRCATYDQATGALPKAQAHYPGAFATVTR